MVLNENKAMITKTSPVLKYREYSYITGAPLLIYLHGHGERGSDPSVIDRVPFVKEFVSKHKDKFTILAPQQITSYNGWEGHPTSEHDGVRFIRWALENYQHDGRLFITGHSMGGRGTWIAATILKERVTGFAVSAGSSEYGPTIELGKLKVPGKAFHGTNDNSTNATTTQGKQAANWYKTGSGIDILKLYDGMGHGIDTKVYREEGLAEWFLSLGKPVVVEPEPQPEPEQEGKIILRGGKVFVRFADKEIELLTTL